jgi:ABC-type phosphate transport system substrate-binding protein
MPLKRVFTAALGAAALLVLLLPGPTLQASGFVVVVNPDNKVQKIPRDELARMFLGKRTMWASGVRIEPAMLDEESQPMRPFLEKTLLKSIDQYRAYWKRLLFSGGGTAPRTFRTSAQVLEFVAREPGAIGIVDDSAPETGVRVVEVTR